MTEDQLQKLRIASEQKRRSRAPLWLIFGGVLVVTGVVTYFAVPRASDQVRSGMTSSRDAATKKAERDLAARDQRLDALRGSNGVGNAASAVDPAAGKVEGSVLTVSGYIIARERIEISPRFMGVVKWIGVKKGDSVTNGQTVVLLDDAENRARLIEVEGQIAGAKVAVEKAELDLRRARELVAQQVEMAKVLDDARLAVAAAEAQVKQLQGSKQLIETWLEWGVIKAPVTGVVLEKLAEANELVTPQNFGGTRGPSTSLLAVADLNDLQVEIDVSESDLGKIRLGQRCRIKPEAYKDKFYAGFVAEIAPEATRAKGTLQIKVQIQNPDRFLTPELSAQVDFLSGQ
jgi:RND family efflux transporter MFP subunit